METGELDKQSLKFIEFIDYNDSFDEPYSNSLIEKAQTSWADVDDSKAWLNEIRGIN